MLSIIGSLDLTICYQICPIVKDTHFRWLTGSLNSFVTLVPQSSLLQRDKFSHLYIDDLIIFNRKFDKAKAIQHFYGIFGAPLLEPLLGLSMKVFRRHITSIISVFDALAPFSMRCNA